MSSIIYCEDVLWWTPFVEVLRKTSMFRGSRRVAARQHGSAVEAVESVIGQK
jgi:hypothetical protein